MAACSCGGQLVQWPGSEVVKPARIRPASIFLPSVIFTVREFDAPPVLNLSELSFSTSAYLTTCNGYLLSTSAEHSTRSTEVLWISLRWCHAVNRSNRTG